MGISLLHKDHLFLCHSDGSECKDGCQVEADPNQLKAYLAEQRHPQKENTVDNQRLFDPSCRYNLMIVFDQEHGPEETLEGLPAERVLAEIEARRPRVQDHNVYVADAVTGMLCGLKYL